MIYNSVIICYDIIHILNNIISVIGGGDAVAAVKLSGLQDCFSYCGINILSESNQCQEANVQMHVVLKQVRVYAMYMLSVIRVG